MAKIENPRMSVEKFLTDTLDARTQSEKCRDYFDSKQWTEAEVKKLTGRKQAPIVVNRVRPKVKGLIGLYNLRKSDPKAYARTPKHEASSHVVTDGLRYVADNNDFDTTRMDVAENFFIEGYGGALIDVRQKKTEIEIRVKSIPWDRIYYDPHSREKHFDDARYKGVLLWMYTDEAKEKFPNKADLIDNLVHQEGETDETFEDRPRWSDPQTNRIRIALHFEQFNGEWWMAIFCGDEFLVKPQISPFLDDDGDPTCPIELVSANVDRDNARYGEVSSFLDQQDEINHRRSKFLHYLNSRQTYGRQGAIPDIDKMKRELSKPDGHVEFTGDQFGKDFGTFDNPSAEIGQFNLYQDAKAELDSVSYNAQLAGERQQGDLSGRAIGKLQQAGTIELSQDYALLASWEKRVYRQIWGRIKQFWTEEKWIRVTDDQDALRWVGFNTQITIQEALEEKINDESEQMHVRRLAAAQYTQMVSNEDPRLQEIIEVRNPIPELDMDIILEQSFDFVNAQEEQFEMLIQFGRNADIDLIDLLEVSQIRGKDELIDKIEKRRQAQAQAAGGEQQMQAQERAAKTENVQANTAKTVVEAQQKQVETEQLIRNPDPQVQAVV